MAMVNSFYTFHVKAMFVTLCFPYKVILGGFVLLLCFPCDFVVDLWL